MAKFSGKDEKINGKWYPVTVEAKTLKEAVKKLYVGQRKSYGTVQAIRGRFSKDYISGSAWERKLIGKNIHSVFTWCKDCHSEGVNIHFNDECGNCGSKNTVRYYDKETIDLLF